MPKRVDANQARIVRALRQAGASVLHLHTIGGGAPDILVGYRGDNFLLEIKSGDGKLNDRQALWHTLWRGQVAVVRSVDEAFKVIGVDIS